MYDADHKAGALQTGLEDFPNPQLVFNDQNAHVPLARWRNRAAKDRFGRAPRGIISDARQVYYSIKEGCGPKRPSRRREHKIAFNEGGERPSFQPALPTDAVFRQIKLP